VMMVDVRHGKRTRRRVAGHGLARWRDRLAIATRRAVVFVDRSLRVLGHCEMVARAIAAHGPSLWTASQTGIHEWRQDGQQTCCHRQIALAGVTDLQATEHAVFALANGWVWNVSTSTPCNLRAHRFLTIGGMAAAADADGAFTFDGEGQVQTRYMQVPRIASALHVGNTAVEIKAAHGRLVVHEGWETLPDA
jgi:hypothetical protein